jgi:hypothetical protein
MAGGLDGDAKKIESMEIRWPSGAVEKLAPSVIDRIVTITEGKGITSAP